MPADQWAALLWLGCWLVALSVVDLRTRRLPDSMVLATLVGLVVIDTASAALDRRFVSPAWADAGALLNGGLLLAVRLAAPAGLGGGDVKLGVPLGWQIGWLSGGGVVGGVLLVLLQASVLALVGCAVQAVVLCRRPPPLAFGPWLGAGTLLVLVFT